MMYSFIGLIIGLPLMFFALYSSSRSSSWKSLLWGGVSLLSLAMIWASIVTLAVPDFFQGSGA